MKNRIKAIAFGLALAASSQVSHAKSELASLSITSLWPTNSNPGNVLLYDVAVERAGQGMLSVDFSSAGLPEGCSVSFVRDPARFTGRNPKFMHFLMVVTCNPLVPTDSFAFTVTGAARRESITVTNVVSGWSSLRTTSSAPTIVSLDLIEGGNVELRGLGGIGESYQIEATTDLGSPSWTNLGSCTTDANGRFIFFHLGAETQSTPMRFYRAVKPAVTQP